MAVKKNFYVVKKGRKVGIFKAWDECKASVDSFPGAIYKGFVTLEEAEEYLNQGTKKENDLVGYKSSSDMIVPKEKPQHGELLTYVDGSYEHSIQRYAFGCVFILEDGRVFTECGSGNEPKSLQHRNVTGEMLGAMYAVRTAIFNGYQEIEICYDYEGIERWVTGEWKGKTELTRKYADAMRRWEKQIQVKFVKVPAHSHVKYNELADQTAKKGLTVFEGIPGVKKLEDMTLYKEIG